MLREVSEDSVNSACIYEGIYLEQGARRGRKYIYGYIPGPMRSRQRKFVCMEGSERRIASDTSVFNRKCPTLCPRWGSTPNPIFASLPRRFLGTLARAACFRVSFPHAIYTSVYITSSPIAFPNRGGPDPYIPMYRPRRETPCEATSPLSQAWLVSPVCEIARFRVRV